MRGRYLNILNLYFRNTLFNILVSVLLLSAVLSKYLIFKGQYVIAEEFWNVFFVVTLWIVFYLGILIKRQMATHRAHLLPGYRKPHLIILFLMYGLLILLGVYWNYGLSWGIPMTEDAVHGGYICSLFMSLVIMCLGYLSIWRVILYAYLISILTAVNISQLIHVFEVHPHMQFIVAGLFILLLIGFIIRLFKLKCDHFEYSNLLSWPPKIYFLHQLNNSSGLNTIQSKIYAKLGSYSDQRNVFKRACQWYPDFHLNMYFSVFVALFLTPFYWAMLKTRPELSDLFIQAHDNVMLMSLTPVLATLGGYYKRMAYWEYELLRPVSRNQYLKERGLLMGIQLITYWIIMVWLMAVVPGFVYNVNSLYSLNFWLGISLTGGATFMVMAWLIRLSCFADAKVVVFNGLLLSGILVYLSYGIRELSTGSIALLNILMLLGVYILIHLAFKGWRMKEAI